MVFTLEVVPPFFFFSLLDMIICKSKFTLAFKNEGTFKVVVKQLQVVVHATENATFALSKTFLENKRQNDLFIHFQVCDAVPLSAVIISVDLSITRSIFKIMGKSRKRFIHYICLYLQSLNSRSRKLVLTLGEKKSYLII